MRQHHTSWTSVDPNVDYERFRKVVDRLTIYVRHDVLRMDEVEQHTNPLVVQGVTEGTQRYVKVSEEALYNPWSGFVSGMASHERQRPAPTD